MICIFIISKINWKTNNTRRSKTHQRIRDPSYDLRCPVRSPGCPRSRAGPHLLTRLQRWFPTLEWPTVKFKMSHVSQLYCLQYNLPTTKLFIKQKTEDTPQETALSVCRLCRVSVFCRCVHANAIAIIRIRLHCNQLSDDNAKSFSINARIQDAT